MQARAAAQPAVIGAASRRATTSAMPPALARGDSAGTRGSSRPIACAYTSGGLTENPGRHIALTVAARLRSHDVNRAYPLSALLAFVLALACAGVVTGCSGDSDDAAQRLERSMEKSRTLGTRMSTNMTFKTGAETVRMRARATTEAGGRRMRMVSTLGGVEMEQYVDGSQMLMSVDSLPTNGAFPAGTRWLKFDMDELLKASGLDASMRELQQIDPTKAAALLNDADIKDAGSGRVRGVAVERYRATVALKDVAKTLGGKSKLPRAFTDGEVTVTLALDDEDLLRAFDMSGDIGPAKMTMDAEITSYSRDIRIAMPSGEGIYDMSGALGGLGDPA